MDPNATLEEIRRIRKWAEENPLPHVGEKNEKFERLCELTEALDEWITNGGFLPKPWALSRPGSCENEL